MSESVVDVSEFEGQELRTGGKCFVNRLPFTDEQRAKLLHVMETRKDITAAAITRVVKTWHIGDDPEAPLFDVSRLAIERHRRGECKCPR